MLNFDRYAVKHRTQNMQNDCHQWILTALECTKFVFGRGSAGGAYNTPQTRAVRRRTGGRRRSWVVL